MAAKVNANPIMIKWAREDAGFTLDELPKSLSKAEKWETGEEKPTWNDLRNLAKKYKRPSFFYFLSQPPEEEEDLIEFRSDEKIEEYSPALKLEIRKAKSRRNAYIKINEDMGIRIPNFSQHISKEKNYLKLGKYIRNLLNVSFETQKKWIFNRNGNRDSTHNCFLNHWKEILFDMGILVFEVKDVHENEMSGCSLYYNNCPIILLNGKNHYNRRIFTLMHELAHLVQGQSTICDVDKHNIKESFCNKVAAEILIPKETLKDLNLFTKKEHNLKVANLSNFYGVSKQSIVYKLYDSGLISNELKKDWINNLERYNIQKKQKDKEKMEKAKKEGKKPHISIVTIKRKQDGTPFTKLILYAYENDVITATEAMRYLDTSLDNIDKLDLEING